MEIFTCKKGIHHIFLVWSYFDQTLLKNEIIPKYISRVNHRLIIFWPYIFWVWPMYYFLYALFYYMHYFSMLYFVFSCLWIYRYSKIKIIGFWYILTIFLWILRALVAAHANWYFSKISIILSPLRLGKKLNFWIKFSII